MAQPQQTEITEEGLQIPTEHTAKNNSPSKFTSQHPKTLSQMPTILLKRMKTHRNKALTVMIASKYLSMSKGIKMIRGLRFYSCLCKRLQLTLKQ